ncbi:hypothetical protein PCC6912_03870 [Chlorogloeopsis fritschii PCC 6912]|uniref:Uncharacterized protein n=1 Tax=Chlorogloeopsis fritschii PCC 6912 TaxID=211165 RepID=A0A433NRX3_CHLFR|nr:hypothetical protein PCC6912_03870 [Chlorogloeopsis fritschii PCC 6912]
MFLLIFNTGGKDWIPHNSSAESQSQPNTISRHRRTASQVAEDLQRIRENYYLERRNVY